MFIHLHACVCVCVCVYVLHTRSHSHTSVQAENTPGFHKHHNRQAASKYVVITYSRAAVSVFHNMLSLREDISDTLVRDVELGL